MARDALRRALLQLGCAGLVAGCSAAALALAPDGDASAPPDDASSTTNTDVDGRAADDAAHDAADALDGADAAEQPIIAPGSFLVGEVDVVTVIHTDKDRRAISPLIYGINGNVADSRPASTMKAVTLVRRGGDRGNSYNWETNVSNGSFNNGFMNDMALGGRSARPERPSGDRISRARRRIARQVARRWCPSS